MLVIRDLEGRRLGRVLANEMSNRPMLLVYLFEKLLVVLLRKGLLTQAESKEILADIGSVVIEGE